ncbi:MAG: FKBP-type peptidylprolyl isomerase [Micrococcales bacterium]|nr:MAG: FKBP-type peptidylprolyl isomerase [Micrococcales bacterium]PIE26192.1 MAG: FKBP-type peptidylprolyl isomerase [Micrococcales bacterium]
MSVLAVALALAGCSGDDGDKPGPTASGDAAPTLAPDVDVSDIDKIDVKAEVGQDPAPSWGDGVFGVAESTRKVLTEGDGPPVQLGQRLVVNHWEYNGEDGSMFDSSKDNPATFKLTDQLQPGLVKTLEGVKVGSRVLGAAAPQDAFGPMGGNPSSNIAADDTVLYVIDVLEAVSVADRASGTPVPPKEGLPTVQLAENGDPKITIPKTDPPAGLVAQPLIKGEGKPVESGQTLDVQYKGVIWAGGKEFDSSWSRGQSASFPIGEGGVIAGWDEGLVGQTVGSQVLLVIPPDKGYGESGQPAAGISGTDTLVFVIDILDAY